MPVTTTSLSIQAGVSQPDPAAPSVAARPASTTGLGLAQPGVDLRAPTVTLVQTTASLSIQPGVSQPDPAAPSVAARPASTTGLGLAQPGVDLRIPTIAPVQTTTVLSIQPGLPRPDAQLRAAGADVDLTALAYAAAYDQCAAKALAEMMAS